MKLFTVSEKTTDPIVCGSPEYPMWTSREPDIHVGEKEYSADDYKRIRAEADRWRIDLDAYYEDDHGYDQNSVDSEINCRPIKDEEILVKDGAFFGAVPSIPKIRPSTKAMNMFRFIQPKRSTDSGNIITDIRRTAAPLRMIRFIICTRCLKRRKARRIKRGYDVVGFSSVKKTCLQKHNCLQNETDGLVRKNADLA